MLCVMSARTLRPTLYGVSVGESYFIMSNRNSRAFRNRRKGSKKRRPRRGLGVRSKGLANVTKPSNVLRGRTEDVAIREFSPFMFPRLQYLPECIIIDLVYPDVTFNRNNATATFLSWRYRMNSIFDPDPLLGSGSVPGYTFWSGGYSAYIVLKLGYDIQVSNVEDSPVDIVCCPSVTDLGSNYAATAELFGNPHATVAQCSGKGGMDRCHLKGWIDLGHFFGNTTHYLTIGSNFGSNPTGLYLNVGGVCATAFTANKGVDIRVNLTYRVLLYQRKNLIV